MKNVRTALAVVAVSVLLGLVPSLNGKNALEKKLPSLDGLTSYGCEIKGPIARLDYSKPGNQKALVWRITFWAEHKSPHETTAQRDWQVLYAYRKNRRKGFDDCDSFLTRVRKAQNARYLASR